MGLELLNGLVLGDHEEAERRVNRLFLPLFRNQQRAALEAIIRVATTTNHNRLASGSRWQAAATFALDAEDIVRWRHLLSHAGELPPLDNAAVALAEQPVG